jgi:hypothetical protein
LSFTPSKPLSGFIDGDSSEIFSSSCGAISPSI